MEKVNDETEKKIRILESTSYNTFIFSHPLSSPSTATSTGELTSQYGYPIGEMMPINI